MREITLINAVKEAYIEEMERDESVFMVGQDLRGGIFNHTKGLYEQFGDRIVDTPISESGMYGTAFGAAQTGEYRPIVDFMFAGFSMVTFSEVSVTTGQQYFLHGGKTPMPIVITAAMGTGGRLANDHAMSVMGAYLRQPGIKVAFASCPADAKGLMKAAIRENNPVFIPFHMGLQSEVGPVPDGDHVVPLGVADVKREGSDVTVLASGMQTKFSLMAAEKLKGEFSVEVVDPRTLDPFDMPLLLKSLEKTNRLVIVDEDWENSGFASTISARVVEEGFDLLDAPIRRVCFPNMPIPGGYMEPYIMPNADKIEAAIRDVCA
mgnify:CR=1 FL=1